jgi:hypothetical protein
MYYQPIVVYREPNVDKKNAILRYIGNRVINSNKNFLCAIVGKTGDGKSYSGLAMCEDYSEMYGIPFNPEIHVVSTLKQLLELIVNKELENNIRIGTPLLFEEPQVETSADEWQSELSKMLAILLSTFRNQRLVVFFTLPFITMLPKKSRMLLHAEFKVLGFDKSTGITTVKPRFLEYNQDMEKFYRKRLIIEYKVEGKRHLIKKKLNKWLIERASDDLINKYEMFKKQFTDDLNKKLLEQTIEREDENDNKKKTKEFLKVCGLVEQYGENYQKILSEIPSITPIALERYLLFIRRSHKASQLQTLSTQLR